ncbi:MAG: putative ubiquitin-RnfH superfamily antitoxin RatB of RatAB toxin-antitoxin module [Candidatus Azotimanducaceae bacterium]|jgi:putative ubiquitin-RnfH superfamily antitoxin RatB of RatAB toxin-antitoxin module
MHFANVLLTCRLEVETLVNEESVNEDSVTETLTIELVFAEPQRQRLLSLSLPAGSTVADALAIGQERWRLDLEADTAVGVFGEITDRSRLLATGDRVEIYRALLMDAKTARHHRAKKQSEDGKIGKA